MQALTTACVSELGTRTQRQSTAVGVHLYCVKLTLLQYGMFSKAKIAAFFAEEDIKENLGGVQHVDAGKLLCSICTVPLGQTQKGSVGKNWRLRFAP